MNTLLPKRLLTESEINQWFVYHTNHDESARMICDQAIAAIEYAEKLERMTLTAMEHS